jgi:hypothetical protein
MSRWRWRKGVDRKRLVRRRTLCEVVCWKRGRSGAREGSGRKRLDLGLMKKTEGEDLDELGFTARRLGS